MNFSKIPFILAALGMVGGIFIAIMFGVNESYFKNKIQDGLQLNKKIMSIENLDKRKVKLEKEASKNWRYYQRFHFHATAIGSMSLAILLLLNFISAPIKIVSTTAWAVSTGGFFYPFVWLFAGIYGPSMGRHEAKETFAIFGYTGGVFLVGLLLLIYLIIRYPLDFPRKDTSKL